MIEVLIALLVLSIGLLGLAALQTIGLRFNNQSHQRTQATFQAYDIIDRIRANRTAKIAGAYDSVALGNKPAITTDCESSSCTPLQMAIYDINKWNTINGQLLPDGKGAISTNGSIRTVTIEWSEEGAARRLSVEVDL